jgi:hypothetical protein
MAEIVNLNRVRKAKARDVAEAQAAVGIAEVARLHQREGQALRIALVSTSVHIAQATCWYVQVEAPNTTCFAPLWGGTVRASPMEVDPRRYDLLAWVEKQKQHKKKTTNGKHEEKTKNNIYI